MQAHPDRWHKIDWVSYREDEGEDSTMMLPHFWNKHCRVFLIFPAQTEGQAGDWKHFYLLLMQIFK